jgi:hypothetical protein
MDNKVGDNAPDAAGMAAILSQLTTPVNALKLFCINISKDQRKRLLHARLGSEPHIARVHDLSVQNGLSIDSIPLTGMLADLALFTLLRPIRDLLATALQMVDDTAGQAESEAWEAFLAYYGALTGMAKHLPALATAIKPTVEFMATGPKKTPAAGGTGPTGPGGGGTGPTGPSAGTGPAGP